MIKIIFITIVLLFNSLPSYGSVDSKGIICECLDCKLNHLDPSSYLANKKPTEIGFHFKINKVAIYYIRKIGDKIKVRIVEIDQDKRRIAVSHKLTTKNPWEKFNSDFSAFDFQS